MSTDLPWPRAVQVCPSAQPSSSAAVVFGIVGGTAEQPLVGYLDSPLSPAVDSRLSCPRGVLPTEVFRFAAPCVHGRCQHHRPTGCTLANRVVAGLGETVVGSPECSIRSHCLWWSQEGTAACLRCPGIVTTRLSPSTAEARASQPPAGS